MYLRKTQNIGVNFNSMASTLYLDTQTKELFIFTNNEYCIDCATIYEQIKQGLNLQENLEELQSYTPSLFLHYHLLIGSKEIESKARIKHKAI